MFIFQFYITKVMIWKKSFEGQKLINICFILNYLFFFINSWAYGDLELVEQLFFLGHSVTLITRFLHNQENESMYF